MRFTYSPDIETKICTHEDSMVEVFSALVETYRSKFDKYGCDIRLEQYWYNNGHVSLKRLPFSNGYTCAFSCSAVCDFRYAVENAFIGRRCHIISTREVVAV